MMDKNDNLVRQFLMENRQQVPDDGFSKRVMQSIQSIPDDSPFVLSRYWTILCWCLGIVIFSLFFMTGHFHFSFQLPDNVFRWIYELQSPAAFSNFLLSHLGNAILIWFIMLIGAFTFVYKQIKTI